MKTKKLFSRDYNYQFEFGSNVRHLMGVQSEGNDLEALLSNATVSVDSDHGIPADTEFEALPDWLQSRVIEDMTVFLATYGET